MFILMAVISRVCVRGGGGSAFARLVARGLPDTDRVHYYVALAPVAGCLVRVLDPKLPAEGLRDTDHYYVALTPVAGCLVRVLDPKLPAEVRGGFGSVL
ncbi:hypothetical protein JYU34_015229 [Plutella xylostella]|uniref:E3 ubiquitin-protein ligase RNF123/RKP TPR repeat domain-containing protein n=1 Tax=Plutella xylostella TaxID=51655 RepID=A0ABQ7Q6N5_PLUXY|nr:hypothetical protein JYU34_015229 [Plutella xylostella]